MLFRAGTSGVLWRARAGAGAPTPPRAPARTPRRSEIDGRPLVEQPVTSRDAGAALPADDDTFDAVVCCDVLEHVTDLDATIREAARVLRPGGIYLYDTINRSRRSKLLVIKLFQEWPATAFMQPNPHEHAMFIKPAELAR